MLAAAALALGLVAAACGGQGAREPWVQQGNACVWEAEEGPVRRVINRADPELCGRKVRHRPADHVRVPPPPRTARN